MDYRGDNIKVYLCSMKNKETLQSFVMKVFDSVEKATAWVSEQNKEHGVYWTYSFFEEEVE